MKKILVIASVMLFGFMGANAAGTDAGTPVINNATLTYDAGGVTQPSVVATADEFVVDRKIDMVLSTTDTDQTDVTPGQTERITNFTFKNEGNSDQNFTFTVANLVGGEADYNAEADTEETEGTMVIEYNNAGVWVALPASGILDIDKEATITLRVKATIPTAAQGGADGVVMNIELKAVATDTAGAAEVETAGADTRGGTPDIVFADGEADATLGDTTNSKGDTAGDGEELARSGYKIQTPILAVTKTSCVINDPVNSTTNPKRIPGATIRYAIEVVNSGTGATEDAAIVDALQSELTYSLSEILPGACSCAGWDGANATPAGTTSVSGQNVTLNFDIISAGTTECAYIEATIN